MGSRRRRRDPVGPFGNPDGSRADIEDLISEFVDFSGDPAYGHLATRANDSMVRVIVGKLGAGKTVYLRRLQDFQAHQDSVYADVPQIGRASCRERVEISVVAVSLKKKNMKIVRRSDVDKK